MTTTSHPDYWDTDYSDTAAAGFVYLLTLLPEERSNRCIPATKTQLREVGRRCSQEQRALLGFPPPGHPYWSPRSLEAVTARYGAFGFDPSPYAAAWE